MYRILPNLPITKDFIIGLSSSCKYNPMTLFSLHIQKIIENDINTINKKIIANSIESAFDYVIELENIFLKTGTKVTYVLIAYETNGSYEVALQ